METELRLTEELFVIPDTERYYLYAPLKGSVVEGNGGLIDLLKRLGQGMPPSEEELPLVEQLVRRRMLMPAGKKRVCDETAVVYEPVAVTFLPTYDCNLRCTYCYARGGEDVGPQLSWDAAKAAIDLIMANAEKHGSKQVAIGFHGGGEPLLPRNMPLIKRCVEYARDETQKLSMKLRVSSPTNGVVRKQDLEWVLENFEHLNISLDGPPDIQNAQRPMPYGRPSSDRVRATVDTLEERKFDYGIRATITGDSVARMAEIVEYFHSISSRKAFHLEPLFECGRCRTTKTAAPSPADFLRYSREARQTAESLGVNIHYSGARMDGVSNCFCGAAGRNFFVTPDARVTTCLEASRPDEGMAAVFDIGAYDAGKKCYSFDMARIGKLQQRTVGNMPHCADCFAKYNCSGDCLAKVYAQSGSLVDASNNSRCDVNRNLLLDTIKGRLQSNR
jgi:uncharacterized protein